MRRPRLKKVSSHPSLALLYKLSSFSNQMQMIKLKIDSLWLCKPRAIVSLPTSRETAVRDSSQVGGEIRRRSSSPRIPSVWANLRRLTSSKAGRKMAAPCRHPRWPTSLQRWTTM